jgi:predicted ATP-dependent serine protease
LTGDVRYVSGAPRRTSEMSKMGFGRIIRPEGAKDGPAGGSGGVSVVEVSTLEEAVAVALL